VSISEIAAGSTHFRFFYSLLKIAAFSLKAAQASVWQRVRRKPQKRCQL